LIGNQLKIYVVETERNIKTLEQALLALRNMDLTGHEGPLLADSVEKVGSPKWPEY
jgi:hypothetical protein